MTNRSIIKADFVKPNSVPSRKVLQLIFEVPEEQADHAMAVLGGHPQSGQNRWCALALLDTTADDETTTEADAPAETMACPSCGRQTTKGADRWDCECGYYWIKAQGPAVDAHAQDKPKGGERARRAGILMREAREEFRTTVPVSFDWEIDEPSSKLTDEEERTRWTICSHCRVRNFRMLDHDEEAGRRFDAMLEHYRLAQRGLLPEQLESARR